MKNTRKTKTVLLSLALVLSLLTAAVAVSAYDGTSDPLISLSYLKQFKATEIDPQLTDLLTRVTNLETKVDNLEKIPTETDTAPVTGPETQTPVDTEPSSSSDASYTFTVLQLSFGQKIMCGESCELILRAGTACVILDANSLGGISDLTGAKDLSHGVPITANHLLLVPRADGRGVLVTSETAFIMVRGAYTIE